MNISYYIKVLIFSLFNKFSQCSNSNSLLGKLFRDNQVLMKCNNCCLLIWKQNVQILTSVNLSWVRQIFLMLELISMFKITSSLFLQCKVDHWNSTRPLLFVLDHRNVTKVKRQMLKTFSDSVSKWQNGHVIVVALLKDRLLLQIKIWSSNPSC